MSPYQEDRLPAHERRRRELLTLLDADSAVSTRRRNVAMPVLATAAVLVTAGIGVTVAQPWTDDTGGGRAAADNGVPRESALVGDPVPASVAEEALAGCLENGRTPGKIPFDATASPGAPSLNVSFGTAPPADEPRSLVSAAVPGNVPSGPSEPGASGAPSSPPPPSDLPGSPPVLPGAATPLPGNWWNVTEPDSAFTPYFTAWEPDGGGGLAPFVIGKAKGPGLVVCHGEGAASKPEFPAPYIGADDRLPATLQSRPVVTAVPGNGSKVATMSLTLWGEASPDVARVDVVAQDGTSLPVTLRGGIWFARNTVPPNNGGMSVRLYAYDAQGRLLMDGGEAVPLS